MVSNVKKDSTPNLVKIKFTEQIEKYVLHEGKVVNAIALINFDQELINMTAENSNDEQEKLYFKTNSTSKWNTVVRIAGIKEKYKIYKNFYFKDEVVELDEKLANHYLSLNVGGVYEDVVSEVDSTGNRTFKRVKKPYTEHIDPAVRKAGGIEYFDTKDPASPNRIEREYKPTPVAIKVE